MIFVSLRVAGHRLTDTTWDQAWDPAAIMQSVLLRNMQKNASQLFLTYNKNVP